MKTICLVLSLFCLWPGIYQERQETPNAIPIIRLDKTRFVLGERVFFWEGVEQTSNAPIPKKYQETCRLTITRPDGTQKAENVGWPIDGPTDSGWLGGASLGGDIVQLGRYALIFEFAGQKTAPTFLFVEDVPILKQIKVNFFFGDLRTDPATLEVHIPTGENVTLVVHNSSDQTLRFPRPGGSSSLVSVSIRKVDGSYSNGLFYPNDKLSNQKESEVGSISFDRFTWELARKTPTITLKPGEIYRQAFSLQTAFDETRKSLPLDPGEYKVTFSTELQTLIGEKNSEWAELWPVRLSVASTAVCIITR
jgi:hypothetical protein